MTEISIIRIPKINLFKKSLVIRNSLNSGITLVEVLIVAAFSLFVIAGGAFGVTTMMDRNAMLEARSQRRMELDRAINYIGDEIKSANNVDIVKSGSTFPGSGTGILLLTIPVPVPPPLDPSDKSKLDLSKSILIPTQRVYFIRPTTDTWFGPNTINRFCSIPESDKIDIYQEKYNKYFPFSCSKGTTISNPVTGIPQNADNVLVDGIIEPEPAELARIQRDCDTTDPNTNAVFGGNQGFYACVHTTNIAAETETTQVYRVDLYLYGRLQSNDPTQKNLFVTTTVYPRVKTP